MSSVIFRPFIKTYTKLHGWAMNEPIAYWSVVVALTGPAMLLIVPPIRRNLGYVPPPPVPKTYPVPQRARDPSLTGYDDPE